MRNHLTWLSFLSITLIIMLSLTIISAYASHLPPRPIITADIVKSLLSALGVVLGLTVIAHWTITRIRISSNPAITPEAVTALQDSKWKFWNIIRAEDWYPSLSLFQFLVWTLVILFVYLTITFMRAFVGAAPVEMNDPNLLIVMGISVTSPIAAGAIGTVKYRTAAAGTNPPAPLPGYSTMLQEGGKPSLTRFQMFAWTFVGIIVFLVHFFSGIYSNLSDANHLNVPTIDGILVTLMGLSQAAYLGGKAVTPTAQKYRIFPGTALRGEQISIFGEGLNFGPTTDTVWFDTTPVARADILSWKPDRIDLRVPAGLIPAKVYEVKVAHSGNLTYVGTFTA